MRDHDVRSGVRPAVKLVDMLLGPGTVSGEPAGGSFRLAGPGRTYTRQQLADTAGRCAAQLLRHGLAPGDRVLALLDHDARGIAFLAAAGALGLRVLMPYNLRAAALPEWRTIVADARPDAVVHLRPDHGDEGQLAGVRALGRLGPRMIVLPEESAHPQPGAPATPLPALRPEPVENFLTLFTSGSTGSPKAVSVSEELVCRRVRSVTRMLRFGPDARVFMSGLLNNTTGVIFSFGALLHDARLILPESRDPARWAPEVAAHRATHIMLRPLALRRFLDGAEAGPADLSGLRVVAYGAAAMPRTLLERGRRAIPCAWVQGYGLSETYGPFCWLDEAAHREGRQLRGAYNVGRPDDTLEVRLDALPGHPPEVGEVLVRGDAVMEGYADVASGTVAPPGEWLRTGDVGAWSPDGDLLLKGRLHGSVMSANGHRVYPEEVETVLAGLPDVREVALVALAGPEALSERPVACVSGPLGARPPAEVRAAVRDALSGVLSREKWPDLVYASDAPFPKSGNDKVLRGEVARRIDRGALIEL